MHASRHFVKVVMEGNPSLLFENGKETETETPWEKSTAKKLLYNDILTGTVPLESKCTDNTSTMKLKDVYLMHPEFAEYSYKKFSSRLSSLQRPISLNQNRADADQDAFGLFVKNNSISYSSHKGYIQWQGSEAQRLLKEDIRLGHTYHYSTKELSISMLSGGVISFFNCSVSVTGVPTFGAFSEVPVCKGGNSNLTFLHPVVVGAIVLSFVALFL